MRRHSDEELLLGCESYRAAERLYDWQEKKDYAKKGDKPEPDYETAKRIAVAVLSCFLFFLLTFFGLLLLSSDFVATGHF